MKKFIANSCEETKNIAKEVLEETRANIILLQGDLGSGKTTFVKGLAEALSVEEMVNSPTFVLMKIYNTQDKKFKRLIHIDFYRLDTVDERDLIDLGIKEFMDDKESLVVIEWPERIKGNTPKALLINFSIVNDGVREIEF